MSQIHIIVASGKCLAAYTAEWIAKQELWAICKYIKSIFDKCDCSYLAFIDGEATCGDEVICPHTWGLLNGVTVYRNEDQYDLEIQTVDLSNREW